VGGQPRGGRPVHRTGRTALQSLLQKGEEADLGAGALSHLQIQGAGIGEGTGAAQPVRGDEVAFELGQELLDRLLAGHAIAGEVAALGEAGRRLLPGRRVVRQQGEPLLEVAGAVEPRFEEPVAVLGIA